MSRVRKGIAMYGKIEEIAGKLELLIEEFGANASILEVRNALIDKDLERYIISESDDLDFDPVEWARNLAV